MSDVCPCCRLTLLTPYTIATWRGQDVCFACHDDLRSHDAEDARRLIARHREYSLSLREG